MYQERGGDARKKGQLGWVELALRGGINY